MTVMTKTEIEALLGMDAPPAQVEAAWLKAAPSVARTALALHQQLADAKAAQALVVERAEAECRLIADRFRSKMNGTTLADASYHLAEAEAAENCATAIRALADLSCVEALAALRAERDEWKRKHGELQDLATEHNTAVAKNTIALTSLAQKAEAERDALAAKLAAAEARVGVLTEAMDGAALAMKSARGVIVSKHEHALLTGALVKCAEAKAGVSIPAALNMEAANG